MCEADFFCTMTIPFYYSKIMVTEINNWNDIITLESPTVINFDDLSSLLLSDDACAWHITGWALDHDPAFEAGHIQQLLKKANEWSDNTEILGGLEINNVTFAFLLDPSDGYRSYSSLALALPNTALKTRIPRVPVFFRPTEKSLYDSAVPISSSLIDAISVDTNQVLLKMGTDYSDNYYPSAEFHCYVQHMHDASPLAEQRMLEDVLSHEIDRADRIVRKM